MMNAPPASRGRNISPLSTDSTDSAFALRYQSFGASDGPYGSSSGFPGARPAQTSPPVSQHPSASTDHSTSSRPSNRSPSTANSQISSASSVARSSDGNGVFANGDAHRSFKPGQEEALQEHYNTLRGFLGNHLQTDAGSAKPTRARDKLLRLSVTQFQELSTDVYDELLRREDDRQRKVPDVPRYLLPKPSFHPKRNQARQKLSTLPPERFRQLATDVFYELERRIPRFAGVDISRVGSPAGSAASSQRAPSRQGGMPNGMRGPPGGPGGFRGPPGSGPGYQSYQPSGPGSRPGTGNRSASGDSTNNSYGRPLPKTFQQSTIVPNKSTMVEDDETEDEDDAVLGLEKVYSNMSSKRSDHRSSADAEKDRETIRSYETQITELQGTIADLEEKLRARENDHDRLQAQVDAHETNHGTEKEEWTGIRDDMEQRLAEAQRQAEDLQRQLEDTHEARNQDERDLRSNMEEKAASLQSQLAEISAENAQLRAQSAVTVPSTDGGEWEKRYNDLKDELADQQKLTNDVRLQATQFLQEMRTLSEQSEAALGKEEQLRAQVSSLESEIQEWKTRYANTKTKLRTLNATSMGLPLQQLAPGALTARQELLSSEGLVNDVDVTRFQIAIDELVHAARDASSDTIIEKMKGVIKCVRDLIPAEEDNDMAGLASPFLSGSVAGHPEAQSLSPSTPRGRVLVEAKQLITAARNHAAANGLSPVSLLDAAAGNLTAAVVDYLKQAGIKPVPHEELQQGSEDVDDAYGQSEPVTNNSSPVMQRNTPPKANGWFARLKGGMDTTQSDDEDDDDYDPYR